jgi:hypothetical protein
MATPSIQTFLANSGLTKNRPVGIYLMMAQAEEVEVVRPLQKEKKNTRILIATRAAPTARSTAKMTAACVLTIAGQSIDLLTKTNPKGELA